MPSNTKPRPPSRTSAFRYKLSQSTRRNLAPDQSPASLNPTMGAKRNRRFSVLRRGCPRGRPDHCGQAGHSCHGLAAQARAKSGHGILLNELGVVLWPGAKLPGDCRIGWDCPSPGPPGNPSKAPKMARQRTQNLALGRWVEAAGMGRMPFSFYNIKNDGGSQIPISACWESGLNGPSGPGGTAKHPGRSS